MLLFLLWDVVLRVIDGAAFILPLSILTESKTNPRRIFEIVAGARRYRVAQLAELEMVMQAFSQIKACSATENRGR